jgi:hypothetical protein
MVSLHRKNGRGNFFVPGRSLGTDELLLMFAKVVNSWTTPFRRECRAPVGRPKVTTYAMLYKYVEAK